MTARLKRKRILQRKNGSEYEMMDEEEDELNFSLFVLTQTCEIFACDFGALFFHLLRGHVGNPSPCSIPCENCNPLRQSPSHLRLPAVVVPLTTCACWRLCFFFLLFFLLFFLFFSEIGSEILQPEAPHHVTHSISLITSF